MNIDDTNNISEANRLVGKHQVDEQRVHILDTAEKIFLEKGLANTSMVELARAVGITKVTLYRYFANKDEIAMQIQMRMLKKISAISDPIDQEFTREELKQKVHVIIDNFAELRDAYRFVGMFDQIYLDNPTDKALTEWTKQQLLTSDWYHESKRDQVGNYPVPAERSVVMSVLTWFLEKLALRGEFSWADSDVPAEEYLKIYEDMVVTYLDKMEAV